MKEVILKHTPKSNFIVLKIGSDIWSNYLFGLAFIFEDMLQNILWAEFDAFNIKSVICSNFYWRFMFLRYVEEYL